MLNLWPPFLFSGISVREISKDFRHTKVRLKKKLLTSNYVGTLFGGSLFAMTDPFYMVMILKNLGKDLGGAIKGFKEGMKDGADEVANTATGDKPKQVPGQTIDVQAKEKS